jgi:hypothetical protein
MEADAGKPDIEAGGVTDRPKCYKNKSKLWLYNKLEGLLKPLKAEDQAEVIARVNEKEML